EFAKNCGADLVGIASMDRFEGAPMEMDPRYIFPEAKSLIALAFRIPRGCFRGIEEGTYFSAYPAMGYANINQIHAPIVLRAVSLFLEDNGYEAVPIQNVLVGEGNLRDVNTGKLRQRSAKRVSPDKPAPDVFFHFRIAAFIAGLGEIGYSKLLLTPEFGPRQRFAFILTDAPLEPDPLFEGKICDRCMLCVRDCSGKAISRTETVKIKVAGREIEWGKLDELKCSVAYLGGNKETNPFLLENVDENEYNKEFYGWGKISRCMVDNYLDHCYQELHHMPAIEGAKGCIRACMIHLEETGKIKKTFKNPFRKRKPWKL
ncbi:MAG: (4Fe-4S)-binding protein, partial [bacterium]|nr:(4Fe-4S)-binding protein [bacterium]